MVKYQNGSFIFLTDYLYENIDHENRVIVAITGFRRAADVDGKPIIPCEYDWIDYARNGKIKAGKNGKEYILDLNGTLIESK